MSTHSLGPTAAGRQMTIAEWEALPEEEDGELVDGMLVEEELGSFPHDIAVAWLIGLLRPWIRGRGCVVASEAKYVLSPNRGRKPDVSVYLTRAKLPPRQGAAHHPPDVVIEVVSPSPRDVRRDRVEKRDEYAAFGVRYYWMLDPQVRTFEIYELAENGKYLSMLVATSGVLNEVPGCPGLSLDLDDLWTELDALPDGEA